MNKNKIELILNNMLSTGGDFAEIFLENKITKGYNYIDNKLDQVNINNTYGIGLRLAKNNNVYYGATNDLTNKSINDIVLNLKNNIKSKIIYKDIKLNRLKKYNYNVPKQYNDVEIKNKLKELNDIIRSKDKRISQVNIVFQQSLQNVKIANHTGKYVSEERILTRLTLIANFKDGDLTSRAHFSKGLACGTELLDKLDYEKIINELIQEGIDKLYAKSFAGQVMPVIIGPGFGAVIFHEACGHAMEATAVADNLSVLSGELNNKIASDKVTIIDDGTITNEWGTTQIDDEGNKTQKNILIKDGVLVNYLIDELSNRKMKMKTTGSSRRESYKYAPTSRMNNTYLAIGKDSVEDMIKSIDLGLYAANLGGGSVSVETGDFNFVCSNAYMIRNGKIAECVKSASLIGNTKEILKEVEMVSDNLDFGTGLCGSLSGWVPVTTGEPTIKIGHILVGGEMNEE